MTYTFLIRCTAHRLSGGLSWRVDTLADGLPARIVSRDSPRIPIWHINAPVTNRAVPNGVTIRTQPAHVLAARPAGNKKRCRNPSAAHFICQENQIARSTLLERRHLVQAYTWQGVPFTTALTRLTLGFHARLERLWEWETLIPNVTPLPQKSHLAISLHLPSG